jgi:TolA-binding protein
MKQVLFLFFSLTFFVSSNTAFAQSTAIYNDADANFKNAKDWFQQGNISLAFPVFKQLQFAKNENTNYPDHLEAETEFYYISCLLKLNDSNAITLAKDFVEKDTHIALVQRMNYYLGEYYFLQQAFNKALSAYQATNIANLSNSEIAILKFHEGYAYFILKDFNKAKSLFNVVRQLTTDPNYIDANYYYGFICFYEKNYKEALAGFTIAQKDPNYQLVVPFYMAEIYYFSGKSSLSLETGLKALEIGSQFYDLQLRQLVGHILFEQKKYNEALVYLKKYVTATPKVRREDLYELSYCYYEASNWTMSIDGFKQLSSGDDSLAQNSMYLLANAYLKTNDKPNARNAFLFCASNNSNAVQKEVATYMYAKLSYELNFLDIALKSLQTFISQYPRSSSITEAKELLVSTLVNSSNYKEALVLFQRITDRSDALQKIYPAILLGRAVEMINDQDLQQADSLLSIVMSLPDNGEQLSVTCFWRGEIAYRANKIDDAIVYFLNFLKNPKNNGQASLVNAHYNLGYCYLKKENYTAAKDQFEQVAFNVTNKSSTTEQDAYVRLADCEYMRKDFKHALVKYDQLINWNSSIADYAWYQKAIILGAMNKSVDKIQLLQQFQQNFPKSGLRMDVNLEIANTYLASENYELAIPPLHKLLADKEAEAMHPQAYLKLGVAYFNLEKNETSLTYFKQLVAAYPNAQESTDAIEYIRTLFITRQQPGDYMAFMHENGRDISTAEADSLSYKSAMLRYEAKDFAAAKQGFTDYVKAFAQGKYFVEANYFCAEIELTNKANNEALVYYLNVAAKAPNKYAERSCLQAARIYYFDQKDYANAALYFAQLKTLATQQENTLEAMRGLLRCQFKTQQWQNAAPNAAELLLENGIANDDRMMASLVVAKNNQLTNNFDQAMTAYKQVITAGRSEYAAESQYRIAEILLQQHKLTDAEKTAFEVIKKWGSYDLWVAKSYLLLGDIYFEQKDLFNAEATFKSIVENAVIAEVKKEAQTKLDLVLVEKNKTNKIEQQ